MKEMDKSHSLATLPIVDLAKCNSIEEVEESLTLMSQYANRSLSHALKAQLQVVRYVSKPELIGSTFDLFFKNLKKAIQYAQDEEDACELRDEASLMLNNFVFFMKAKLEMEVAVNQKEGAKLLSEASQGLAESIVTLGTMYAGGASKAALKSTAIKEIGSLIFNPDNISNNWLSRGIRWMFKKSRTDEKEYNFYESLDTLAEKLIDQYDVIGPNDLIAGIYENYKDGLMEHHSWEWRRDFVKVQEDLEKSWQVPLFIVGIGGAVGCIVWLIRWIVSLFGDMTPGWAQLQWMWTGIGLGGIAVIVALVYLCRYWVYNSRGNKKLKSKWNYYNNIIDCFRE